MPLIKVETSMELSADQRSELLDGLSKTVSEVTGKPETYVMAAISRSDIILGGDAAPAAFADVRGIGGLDSDTNARLSKAICSLLSETISIAADKVYINFTDVPASNWGWNGGTF